MTAISTGGAEVKPKPVSLFGGVSREKAAEKLKTWRTAKYTQDQFVKLIGMRHVQYLSSFENAKMDWRNSDQYKTKIIEALALTREQLLEVGIGRAELFGDGIELDAKASAAVQVLEIYEPRLKNGINPLTGAKVYIPRQSSMIEQLSAYQIDSTTKVSESVKSEGIGKNDIIVIDTNAIPTSNSLIAAWDEDRETMLLSRAGEPSPYVVFHSLDDAKQPVVFKAKDLKAIGVIVWRGGALEP